MRIGANMIEPSNNVDTTMEKGLMQGKSLGTWFPCRASGDLFHPNFVDSIHSIVWTRCHRSIKSRILHKNQDTFPSSSEQNRGSCHLWFSMLGPKNMGKYQLRELGSDAFPIGYILETNHGGSTGPHPRHVNHVVFCSQRWCGNFQETPSDSWCHVVKPKVEEIVSQVPAKRMSPSNFFKTSFQPKHLNCEGVWPLPSRLGSRCQSQQLRAVWCGPHSNQLEHLREMPCRPPEGFFDTGGTT